VGEEGKHGRLRTFADDDGEAVIQFLDRCTLLEGSEVLRQRQRRENETDKHNLCRSNARLHPASIDNVKNSTLRGGGEDCQTEDRETEDGQTTINT
jgi:hypothetical protein